MASSKAPTNTTAPTQLLEVGGQTYAYRRFGNGPGLPLLVARIASAHRATASQVALAWLLHRSPVMLPIPGTLRVAHLEENGAAASLSLGPEEIVELDTAA
jgi:aryl-alcohol dehydrogenase-like predicted oxidoreductase